MKILILLASLGFSLLASQLIVKKADVKISVNTEKFSLQKGQKIGLDEGSTICFLEGDGKIIINKRKQLSKKSKKCYTTPVSKDFDIESFVKGVSKSAKIALISGELKISNGVATKSTQTSETLKGTISIQKDLEELLIYSSLYGPLPVTLKIVDTKNNILQVYENEDEVITLFRIPKIMLKDKYQIIVTNAFDEELIHHNIKIK